MKTNNDTTGMETPPSFDDAPDEAGRRIIRGIRGLSVPVSLDKDLDLTSNIIVSAGAGSGKTTALIERLIALIRSGIPVNELVAITFTKKAAGELQERFFAGLMEAREDIGKRINSSSGEVKAEWLLESQRIEAALERSEDAFVGTIHSFCARLLRYHPVAAGIPPDFEQVDDADEQKLRKTFWNRSIRERTEEGDLDLALLREMEIPDEALFHLFDTCIKNAGVTFTQSGVERPEVVSVFVPIADCMKKIYPLLPQTGKPGPFQLAIERAWQLVQPVAVTTDLERIQVLEIIVSSLKTADPPTFNVTVRQWGKKASESGALAYALRDGEDDLCAGGALLEYVIDTVQPALKQWQHWLHDAALRFVTSLTDAYRDERLSLGWLTYDDLLREANRIVRDHERVREMLQQRFTRVLVDEFQDTDPVQASLMFNLCASSLNPDDWRKNDLLPGRLFVVGDDKQSVYRFRKADFQAFSAVCSALSEKGGRHLQLTANFRSDQRVCAWVNEAIKPLFDEDVAPYQANWQPLEPAKGTLHEGEAVRRVCVGKQAGRAPTTRTVAEARAIASIIHESVDGASGKAEVGYGDWLILVRGHSRVPAFLNILSEEGIPVALEGGKGDEVSDVISLVHNLLRCLVDPTDHVSLAATLTSLWFGVSDADLHAYRIAGGSWNAWLTIPVGNPDIPESMRNASLKLREWAEWTRLYAPLTLWEKILADSGIEGALRQRADGDVAVGMMEMIGELFSRLQGEGKDMPACVREIARYQSGERSLELFSDNVPFRDSVRIMTIHGAKGLQAKRVVLADVIAKKDHKPDRHIWRDGPALNGLAVVKSTVGQYSTRLLEPFGWVQAALEEKRYEQAEENRLIYVAATRAIEQLIVCTHAEEGKGTWDQLIPALVAAEVDSLEVLPTASDTLPGFRRRKRPTDWARENAEGDLLDRISALETSTWRVLRPSESEEGELEKAQSSYEGPKQSSRPDGRKVGTAWHTMFESLVAYRKKSVSETDVQDIVQAVLSSADSTVRSALQNVAEIGLLKFVESEVWQTLKNADRVLTEVPFTLQRDEEGEDVLYSGIVDLAFRTDDSWTIVDYKSDAADEKTLITRHASQIEAYVDAWMSLFDDQSCKGIIWSTALGRAIPVNH